MFRGVFCFVLSCVLSWSVAVLPASAQNLEQPPTLSVNRSATLPRAAEASRFDLIGTVPLYSVAVYAERLDRAQLASPDVAKALRIVVTFKEDLRRTIRVDWRRELIPRLEPSGQTALQGLIAPLQQGDTILVEYTRQRGTTISVDTGVAVRGASHDLMLAFLDHWLGQRPVSEEMKRALLGS